MAETHTSEECPACTALARDEMLGHRGDASPAHRIGHEGRILADIKRAEDRASDAITAFAGSMKFVYIHTVWFFVWIALNVGMLGAALVFDEFPFGLLTMIVSLEAIFLSTFVMISQNRQAVRADIRSDLDFVNNVRSEVWTIHIGQKLGLNASHVEDAIQRALESYKEERAG